MPVNLKFKLVKLATFGTDFCHKESDHIGWPLRRFRMFNLVGNLSGLILLIFIALINVLTQVSFESGNSIVLCRKLVV
jgi:hypothetical protein